MRSWSTWVTAAPTGADARTGDGAGILIQMPHEFFREQASEHDIELPHRGEYAVGMTFLPQEQHQRHRCEVLVEQTLAAEGLAFLGWRDVPINRDAIGVLAAQRMPRIRQFFVRRPHGIDDEFLFEPQALRRPQADRKGDQEPRRHA